MKHNQMVTGVLAGLFTGTLLGVLFAPAKGSETRKKLFHKRSAADLLNRTLNENYIIPGYENKRLVDESF